MKSISSISAESFEKNLLNRIQAFHFFEKEEWIREAGKCFLLFIIGLAFFHLSKMPGKDCRYLVVSFDTIFFRYSVFGYIFIIASIFQLKKLEKKGLFSGLLFTGIVIYTLHGFTSFFDYSGVFFTNVFLEILTTGFPIIIIVHFLRLRYTDFNRFFPIIMLILLIFIVFLFCILYAYGFFFILAEPGLAKVFTWYVVSSTGFLLRAIHFLLGLVYIAGFLKLFWKRKQFIKNFAKMEKLVYLCK